MLHMIIKWNKFQKADLKLYNLIDPKYLFPETIVYSGILKIHFSLVPNLKVCQKNSYVSIPKLHMYFYTGMRQYSVRKAKRNETKLKQWDCGLHQHHGI